MENLATRRDHEKKGVRRRAVLSLLVLSLVSTSCYFGGYYFQKLFGLYGLIWGYYDSPSRHEATMTLNKDGTVTVDSTNTTVGGPNPTVRT